jgi:alkyl sulfatase BDS1-like metallo-beta-lactamase superfamily hydrolase
MPGDDFYRAFPNLYPIRGVGLRPPEVWIASLNEMIDLSAEHLVPGHMRPITGAENVRAALTVYRDGIQSILDQTIEGIRRGERPDDLVQRVELPPHLADSPYVQEYYGSVPWSVRAIYCDYVGWFDGNATNMFSLSEEDRARRIIDLVGGADRVLSRAREALAGDDFQWTAELADFVLAVDSANVDAKRIKARALMELGERQINATARNYYLTSALYLLRDLPPE